MKNAVCYLVVCIRFFEYLGARNRLFRRIYCSLFYRKMIKKEVADAGLEPGQRVLHIGCGPMPYTVLALADSGLQVCALDHDSAAVDSARRIIRDSGLDDHVTVCCEDGLTHDVSGYDAVWISLHAEPKDRLMAYLRCSLKPGAVIIYRNPRIWARLFYRPFYPLSAHYRVCKQFFGKESVAVYLAGEHGEIPLDAVWPGASVAIIRVPEHPLLSPLGYRSGKKMKVLVRSILDGPIISEVEGRRSALTRSLARGVRVVPATDSGVVNVREKAVG